MEFKNILFPVDFSDRCRAVVPNVQAVRRRFGASVTLLHLVKNPAVWYGGMEAPLIPDYEELAADAEAGLVEFAAAEFPGMKVETVVETVVEEGDPGERIAHIAAERQSDLIMMPTHGRGPFRAALLGSVTAKVLHDATCPVWTAAHAEDMLGGAHTDWRSILCAVDLAPESLRLIRCAGELGETSGAQVRIVHAVPAPEAGVEVYFNAEFEESLKESARKQIGDMQAQTKTNFEVCLDGGKVSRVVARAAAHHDADLIVIGSGVMHEFAGRLRSAAYAIIRDSARPVLRI